MTLHPQAKKALILGSLLLALGVLIGAFGAHGLKNMVTADKLVTFETGVRYHFYHAFGILFLGAIQQILQTQKFNVPMNSFLVGILLFSFNCYLYALTGIKTFAMIVPVGGMLFVVGWIVMTVKFLKIR
jgi:uncharacterized membrane protein YgdD (TMEM256/DUF423 family)